MDAQFFGHSLLYVNTHLESFDANIRELQGGELRAGPANSTLPVIIAEVYKGANTTAAKLVEQYASQTRMKLLDVAEHRALFANADYSEVQIFEEPSKGWILSLIHI